MSCVNIDYSVQSAACVCVFAFKLNFTFPKSGTESMLAAALKSKVDQVSSHFYCGGMGYWIFDQHGSLNFDGNLNILFLFIFCAVHSLN